MTAGQRKRRDQAVLAELGAAAGMSFAAIARALELSRPHVKEIVERRRRDLAAKTDAADFVVETYRERFAATAAKRRKLPPRRDW